MNRREFLLKLGKSVLVITAVTATGRLLSKKDAGSESCATDSTCAGCGSLQRCGLPKRNDYLAQNKVNENK
jgi:hypothetical protein